MKYRCERCGAGFSLDKDSVDLLSADCKIKCPVCGSENVVDEEIRDEKEDDEVTEEELSEEDFSGSVYDENFWEKFNDLLERGGHLFEEKSFGEALPLLLEAYALLTAPANHDRLVIDLGQDKYGGILMWLCFRIGFCYNDEDDFISALYYLEQVKFCGDIASFAEWINALAQSGHPSVLYIVERMVNDPEDLYKLFEDEDERATIMSFLERRLGYLYTEYGRLHEARLLFTRLLADPRSKDFAREELDYLDSLEQAAEEDNDETE